MEEVRTIFWGKEGVKHTVIRGCIVGLSCVSFKKQAVERITLLAVSNPLKIGTFSKSFPFSNVLNAKSNTDMVERGFKTIHTMT